VTIDRGRDWGRPAPLPPGVPLVRSDGELAALLAAAHDRGAPPPEVGLLGGDLWRTLGAPPHQVDARFGGPAGEATRVLLDGVRAVLDGVVHHAVAHLVARAVGWRGPFLLVMNAEWLGEWKLAPRAHPGDGLLDVLDGSLALRQRLQARRRARFGEHVPHPAIRTYRAAELAATFEPPRRVWLDGRSAGRCRHLEVAVEPDALIAYV
jgi:YegS C-terminal NAD kinase beta sandwich-like domain